MIILTKEQAEYARGFTGNGHGLDPSVLADGITYVLPESVIDNPCHSKHKVFLMSMPIRDVLPEEYIQVTNE